MVQDWIECTLADTCSSIDYGYTASAVDSAVGPKFLRITDIVSGHIDWGAVPYVSADEKTLEKYQLHNGDIVIARTGASTGASSYVHQPPVAVFASYLVRLKIKPEFDSRYLAYYLKSDAFWSYIRGVLGDKSAQPNASASTMTRAPIKLPRDKAEQREIAHILGTLDDKIQLNRRMNATLEAIARAIFKSWFVDFDPVHAKARGEQPYGMDAETAALFPDAFEDSELGPIPAGWGVKRFGEISEKPQYGYTASAQDVPVGPRFLRIKDINKAPWIEWANVPYCKLSESDHEKYKLHAGDIVIARMADPGHSAFIEDEVDAVFASYLIRFRSVDATLDRYLQFWLRSDSYWSQVEGTKTGTTRSSLNAQVLSSFRLVLPPVEIAAKFSDYVTALRQMIVRNNEEIRTLSVLRDALLPKLISGEIRIGDVESELTA